MSGSSGNDSETEKTTFDLVKTWFLNSPTHGIQRISRANSIPSRLFWSLTFLIFATFMCIFIYTVIMKFTAHPTKISLSIRQYRHNDHIPTLTFCNLHPLRNQSVLNESAICPGPTCTDAERYNSFIQYMSKFLAENINNSQPTVLPSGYELDELLVQCIFNSQTCNPDFVPFFYPKYGNCYTYHYGINTKYSEPKNTDRGPSIDDGHLGDGHTLFLELFLYENESIPFIDERAGFRIFIHRQHEIPILSPNTLFLAPTTFTKLIYSQRIITFSQNCRRDLTEDMQAVFNPHSTRYSQALCFKLCEFRLVEKVCQCTDPLFMLFVRFFSKNRTTPIDTSRSCSMNDNCLADRTNFDPKQSCPACLPECELIQYTIQSSYAAYPNKRSVDRIFQRVEKHLASVGHGGYQNTTSTCVNNRKELLLANIVAVEISASPYATEILAESPMYTWVDLISSIGGQAGLWIGISLISFVEFGELLFLLFCHFIAIIYKKMRNQWKLSTGRYSKAAIATDFKENC